MKFKPGDLVMAVRSTGRDLFAPEVHRGQIGKIIRDHRYTNPSVLFEGKVPYYYNSKDLVKVTGLNKLEKLIYNV